MARCLVWKIYSSDRCMKAGPELVKLPFQYREIAFYRHPVRKDCREAATECAETFETGDTVPGTIEQNLGVVFVDHLPGVLVVTVHLEKASVVRLDLLNSFGRPERIEVVAIRLEHVLNEIRGTQPK